MAGTGLVSDCSCKSGPCEGSIVSMSVVMLSISHSTADCKLTKTFVMETLYYCNRLCFVKCSTSLLTFKTLAMHLYHSTVQLSSAYGAQH